MKLMAMAAFLGLFFTISCRSPKEKQATAVEVSNETSARFIVSFFSPGNGIDHKARAKLVEFLKGHTPTLAVTKTKWGREGEVDFCFMLSELSEKEQETFIKKVRDLLAKSSRVRFYENKECRKPRE